MLAFTESLRRRSRPEPLEIRIGRVAVEKENDRGGNGCDGYPVDTRPVSRWRRPSPWRKEAFPKKIALPDGFAPEGIEIGSGEHFYVGSVGTGAIWIGDLRTGAGRDPGRGRAQRAFGDRASNSSTVDSGSRAPASATRSLYDVEDGRADEGDPLATGPDATFINDAVATKDGGLLHRLAAARASTRSASRGNGRPRRGDDDPARRRLPVHVAGQFNLNGIVATPDGKTLIAVQTISRKLLTIDPETGAATTIDLGGYDLTNGDGLLLRRPDAVRRPEPRQQGCGLRAVA